MGGAHPTKTSPRISLISTVTNYTLYTLSFQRILLAVPAGGNLWMQHIPAAVWGGRMQCPMKILDNILLLLYAFQKIADLHF